VFRDGTACFAGEETAETTLHLSHLAVARGIVMQFKFCRQVAIY